MIITIGSSQWVCTLATDVHVGLSGVESLPVNEGMMFDMGSECSRIDINMSEMLFPLDVVFIGSGLAVVGVLHDVNPGDEAYFEASNSSRARYFMEVNAGEAASVNVGDVVTVQDGIGGSGLAATISSVVVAVAIISVVFLVLHSMYGKATRI